MKVSFFEKYKTEGGLIIRMVTSEIFWANLLRLLLALGVTCGNRSPQRLTWKLEHPSWFDRGQLIVRSSQWQLATNFYIYIYIYERKSNVREKYPSITLQQTGSQDLSDS